MRRAGCSTACRRAALVVFFPIVTVVFASTGFGRGRAATYSDLQVGQAVVIEARLAGPQSILAKEIEIQPKGPRPDKLRGAIQVVGGDNSLIVLGVKVLAASDTRIEDSDRRPIRFSGLQKGVKVKVEGKLQDGALHATRIKISKKESLDKVDIEGVIQAIDRAQRILTVMGLAVRVTPTVQIKFDSRYSSD